MAKSILGVDFGHSCLKVALMNRGQVKKVASADMPDRLMKDGRIVSIESAGELLKEVMRENGIRCNEAAVLVSGSRVYVREIHMPKMTEEQLLFNLPYEFKDYITDELKNYVFDYAILPEDVEGELHMMAVAAPKELLGDYRAILRKAGLRMAVAAPVESCISRLIQSQTGYDEDKEFCVLDLGHAAIRMLMFRGDCLVGDRVLDFSMKTLEEIIASEMNVDSHLAHTYLMKNYENCQELDRMHAAYNQVAVELVRAMNFYRFSNPDNNLNEIWVCGGGSSVQILEEVIEENLNMEVHNTKELQRTLGSAFDVNAALQAIAVTQ